VSGAKRPAWVLPLVVAIGAVGCQDGYPIAATRCDRWCELTRDTQCGVYNPASCVSGCEVSFGSAACYAEFDALLGCLQSVPASDRACDYYNFGTVADCSAQTTTLDDCSRRQAPRGPQ